MSSNSLSGEDKAFAAADRKNRAEKRGLMLTLQTAAVIVLCVLYLLTEFQLDAVIYKITGTIGYWFDADWASPVKASLGTLKPTLFTICAGFLWFTLRIKV